MMRLVIVGRRSRLRPIESGEEAKKIFGWNARRMRELEG